MKRVWYFYAEFESEGDYEFYTSRIKALSRYKDQLETHRKRNGEAYEYTVEIAEQNHGRAAREEKSSGYTCGILEWGYKEVN